MATIYTVFYLIKNLKTEKKAYHELKTQQPNSTMGNHCFNKKFIRVSVILLILQFIKVCVYDAWPRNTNNYNLFFYFHQLFRRRITNNNYDNLTLCPIKKITIIQKQNQK